MKEEQEIQTYFITKEEIRLTTGEATIKNVLEPVDAVVPEHLTWEFVGDVIKSQYK